MISVVIIAYNIELYIKNCINSIIIQLNDDIEMIIVDDGSTDRTGEICDEISKEFKNVTIIHKKNGGQNSARIAGVKKAKGEYVIFVDGDDWIDTEYLDKTRDLLNRYPNLDLICYDMKAVTNDNERILPFGIKEGYYQKDSIEEHFFPKLIEDNKGRHLGGSLCGKVFKRKLLISCFNKSNSRIRIGEDAAVVRPYILYCETIYVLNEPLYYYNRMNLLSTTKQLAPIDISNTVGIRSGLKEVFGYSKVWEEQINRNTIHNLYITCLSRFNGRSKYLDIRKELISIFEYDWKEDVYNNCGYKNFVWNLVVISMKYRLPFVFYLFWRINNIFRL